MKKLISLILAIFMLGSTVIAATSKEQQLKNTKDSITRAQNQIKQNESQQKSVRSEINSLETNINSTENQIEQTQREISEVEASIRNTEEDIKVTQANYDKNYELRKNRMVAYYKVGSTSLEESVSKIDNEPDKMYMEKAIEKVVNYDTGIIEALERDRIALEEQKAKLDEENVRLASLKADLEVKLATLNTTKEKRTSYLSALQNDHKELEKSIDDMNAEADKLAKEIAAAASKNTKYTGGKMTWPLPGYYYITSPFGNRLHPILKVYKLHTGVDIAGSGCNGKPVVAAASGTVIVAKYNAAYGNYVVIDHGGGITTLYAHSSKLEVKAGDKVKAGQEIMKVGTTGYSTGPHLHFEVRENGKYVDPIGKGYIKN
ncbi:MAG: peptidoglycan DD-metalloendopeptidase family protein [Clostridia bacterium]|nr:peptidoglycan DD-metalloendopeptidase family protein [Clostridia bacterium]